MYAGGCLWSDLVNLQLIENVSESRGATCPSPLHHTNETIHLKAILVHYFGLDSSSNPAAATSMNIDSFPKDVRVDAVKFLHGLTSSTMVSDAPYLHSTTNFVLKTTWSMMTSQYDCIAHLTMPLFFAYLKCDAASRTVSQLGQFQEIVYRAFHNSSWHSRSHGIDCGFGLFGKLTPKICIEFKKHISIVGAIAPYLVMALFDSQNEVRLQAASAIKKLDGMQLKAMLDIWASYLATLTDPIMVQDNLKAMIRLNSAYPSLSVLPCKTAISMYRYGATNETSMDKESVTKMTDQQNTNELSVAICLHQIGNNVPVLYEDVLILLSIFAQELGLRESGKNEQEFLGYDQNNPFHRSFLTMLVAQLPAILDRYHLNWIVAAVQSDDVKGDKSQPATSSEAVYVPLIQVAKNLINLSTVKESEMNLSEDLTDSAKKVERIAHRTIATIFSALSSASTLLKLDVLILKGWIELLLVYCYKVGRLTYSYLILIVRY